MRRTEGIEVYELREVNRVLELKIKESDFNGSGWLKMKMDSNCLFLKSYDTRNSPLHNFTTCPAHTLLGFSAYLEKRWEEEGESNNFVLKSSTVQKPAQTTAEIKKWVTLPSGTLESSMLLSTKTIFSIPKKYTGPHYKERRIWWLEYAFYDYSVPFLVITSYKGNPDNSDTGTLIKSKFNKKINKAVLVFEWKCYGHGPNKFNIHNTGYEDRFKPPRP